MVDIVSKKMRSQMMANIRSQDTRPEILTRRALHRLGYRYQLYSKIGKIKPDLVLTRWNVAILVHGCYWHQHKNCKLAYSDRAYSSKWTNKFEANVLRDKRVLDYLINSGWRVAVIWECATRKANIFEKTITELDNWIKLGTSQYYESSYHET